MNYRCQIDIRDRSLSVYEVKGNSESHVKTVVATADTPVVSYVIDTAPPKKAKPKASGKRGK